MAEKKVHQLIIVGSGPAGLTAGIYGARANLKPLIFEGSNPGGQLVGTSFVENWPGMPHIRGPELMTSMLEHARASGCQIVSESVTKLVLDTKPFSVWAQEKQFFANSIIIASGALPKRLNCPGESTYWGKGVSTCAICDGALYKDKEVIIVGGGDSAAEAASFMTKFTDKITLVQLLDRLTASYAMQERILHNPAIKIEYNSTITEVKGDGNRITGAIITNTTTNRSVEKSVDALFVAIGLTPQTSLFKDQLNLTEQGQIVLCSPGISTATSVPGVFAAGDVIDPRYRQAITAAGSGCMAALDAEQFLREAKL